jgi:hypothetical protein
MKTLGALGAIVALGAILPIAVVFAGFNMNTVTLPRSEFKAVRAVNSQSHLPAAVAPVLERSCRDCHSNQTVWPWYSQVPPMSFLVKHDVDMGRAKLDFSKWATGAATPTRNQLQEICDAASDGSMPPRSYRMLHRRARLASADIEALCNWAENAGTTSLDLNSGR